MSEEFFYGGRNVGKYAEHLRALLREVESESKLCVQVSSFCPPGVIYVADPKALGTLHEAVAGGGNLLKTIITADEREAERIRQAARGVGLVVVDGAEA